MVNLLGIKLDGAGDLRSVDSRALLSHITRQGVPADDPEAAAAVAARFGAGLFVMGDVVEGGRRLQVAAALYRTDNWASAVAEASAEGEEPFALVDDVATQLLAGVEGGPGARVRRIAAVTTSSYPAFRAYLEGEAAFRTFDFQTAFEAFQRAVALDTLYAMAYYRLAMAYYRLSVAAEWLTRADEAQEAAEMAFRHASRLTDRDRQLPVTPAASRTGTASCWRPSGHGGAASTPKPNGATGRSSALIRRMWRRGSNSGKCSTTRTRSTGGRLPKRASRSRRSWSTNPVTWRPSCT
jgi:tetratricopeptide (TPR) repeat protein